MVRPVKEEPGPRVPEEGSSGVDRRGSKDTREELIKRRVLRSRYLQVKNLIGDEKEHILNADSEGFQSIITEVENLHQQVQKPREQIADAEALLDLANSLVTSVQSQSNNGLSPSEFINALLKNFGQQGPNVENNHNQVRWRNLGLAVSHVLTRLPGCCTMLGPMNTELKQRKPVVHRKQTRPTESARPEELQNAEKEETTDTDKNMSTMFDILRKHRRVRLEHLILNRGSFAQTVENIFALSFLVKDGRAEITVDDNKQHLVSPRNAPAASAVASGEVTYNHFVFRFDFKDWKMMLNVVKAGDELMPHRNSLDAFVSSQFQCEDSQSAPPSTPIRKLTRNRGLVIQEQGSPEHDVSANQEQPRKKAKRFFPG